MAVQTCDRTLQMLKCTCAPEPACDEDSLGRKVATMPCFAAIAVTASLVSSKPSTACTGHAEHVHMATFTYAAAPASTAERDWGRDRSRGTPSQCTRGAHVRYLHSSVMLGDNLELAKCRFAVQLLHNQTKSLHSVANVIHDCSTQPPSTHANKRMRHGHQELNYRLVGWTTI